MVNCITVTLPTALVRLFPGSANAVELKASTVREVIDQLNARWPGMRDRLSAATSTSMSPVKRLASRCRCSPARG